MPPEPPAPSCALWREAISAALDGEAMPAGAEDLDGHLAACDSCRSFAATVEVMHRSTRVRPAESIPDLAARVFADVKDADALPALGRASDRAGGTGVPSLRTARRLVALTASAAAAVLVIAMIGLRVTGSAPAAADVSLASAFATVTPDGSMASVYVSLKNAGGPDDLVGVSSSEADEATLHNTESGDGYSLMTHEADYEIPGDATISFQPGGAHVMLEGLHGQVIPGDTVPLTLSFASSPPIEVAAKVVPMTEIFDYVEPAGG